MMFAWRFSVPSCCASPREITDARRAIRAALDLGCDGRGSVNAGSAVLALMRGGVERDAAIRTTLQRIAQERNRMFDPDVFDLDQAPKRRWQSGEFALSVAAIVAIPLALVALGYWMGSA